MTIAIDVAGLEQSRTCILLKVSGSVDMFTRAPFAAALRHALRYREVMVDLSGVTFFSAAGIHVLEDAEELLAQRGGVLRLVPGWDESVALVLRAVNMQNRWLAQPGSLAHQNSSGVVERQVE
jgi:anti-anti-sigma factor